MSLSTKHSGYIQAALGCDEYGHYCGRNSLITSTAMADPRYTDILDMIEKGLLKTVGDYGHYIELEVTPLGRRKFRNAMKYKLYLSWNEAYGGSFKKFLQERIYEDFR